MPKKLVWTDAQDTTIRHLRAEGATWDAIAAVLRLNRWTAIERGRFIGARPPPPDFIPPPEDPNREPLPAGHPTAWNALVRGTGLEGMPYEVAKPAAR
ncbi:MAG: AsnC family protein [Rhodospirillales bacterium]